jgi:hypothetical protein
MDFTEPKVRVIENFIDQETCDYLISTANETGLWSIQNATPENYPDPKHFAEHSAQWNDRVINFHRLVSEGTNGEFVGRAWDILQKSKAQVAGFFRRSPDQLFLESWEVVKWYYPLAQKPHIDYIDPDFNRETDLPPDYDESLFPASAEPVWKRYNTNKHYTSMLYLNGDFEGGEIYFPMNGDFSIKPKAGLLVIFSGDLLHPHGVRQITSGTRYVNTAFWCRHPNTKTWVQESINDGTFEPYWLQ